MPSRRPARLGMPVDVCGKIQDETYRRAAMLDAGELMVYHGFLGPAELPRRYAGARATLVTPHWIEAFGNTVVESMACGTPAVAYDRRDPAESVEHGRSGGWFARAEEFSFGRIADRFEGSVGWRPLGPPMLMKRAPHPGALTQPKFGQSGILDPGHVLGLQSLGPLLHLELYLRAFIQGTIAVRLDGRKVYEHVVAATALDETVAFSGVKPFHDAFFSHYFFS